MARGDGIDRTNARNMRLTETKIGNTQQHNEREKDSYVNQDIVPERTPLNVHFKAPSAGYQEMFSQMEADGVISTRGIKADAHFLLMLTCITVSLTLPTRDLSLHRFVQRISFSTTGI